MFHSQTIISFKLMMKTNLIGMFLLVGSILFGQSVEQLNLPYCSHSGSLVNLRQCKNLSLQEQLEFGLLANPKWHQLIKQKKLAVGIVNLDDPSNTTYASVNGGEMMYAASLPKIAILLAAMDAIQKKELPYSKEIQKDLRLMISKSDNRASTRMIDRLGYEKIEAVLTNPKYELYDEDYGGGLWVGKRYAAGGARNPEPLEGLSHAATVEQVCRFYYMLAFGKLINPYYSQQMLEMLINPQIHHKFVNTFERVAPEAKLFRKSGSWSNFHSDSILVWGPERRYILVALVEDQNGETIIRQLAETVDKLMIQNKDQEDH